MQSRDFYASMTTLRRDALGDAGMARMLEALDLDPQSLLAGHEGADRLVILRHTLMNPFLQDSENGISYIDLYFDHLLELARGAVASCGFAAKPAGAAAA